MEKTKLHSFKASVNGFVIKFFPKDEQFRIFRKGIIVGRTYDTEAALELIRVMHNS